MIQQLPGHSSLQKALPGAKPWIAGILNLTPDSFSDGGLFRSPDAAASRAR